MTEITKQPDAPTPKVDDPEREMYHPERGVIHHECALTLALVADDPRLCNIAKHRLWALKFHYQRRLAQLEEIEENNLIDVLEPTWWA